MTLSLPQQHEQDFLKRGFSRRHFAKIAALMGAGATLPFYNEAALAQLSQIKDMPADAVKINANENPLGPAPEAIEAMTRVLANGGRYSYGLTDELRETMAALEGLPADHVAPFAGSSPPLTQAILAFTSPDTQLRHLRPRLRGGRAGRQVHRRQGLPRALTKTYAHDVKAMAAADPNAGVIYVCNPNNPTGTVTPDADIDWLVDNLPKGAVLLLDEAYIHIAGAKPRSDLVLDGKDVILLRTFSKIYGMAGLRAGAAIARPELLERITPLQLRSAADHGHGGGHGQPEAARPGPHAAQDHRRHARRRLRVSRPARLPLRAVGIEQVHGRREAAGRGDHPGAARRASLHRSGLAELADLRPGLHRHGQRNGPLQTGLSQGHGLIRRAAAVRRAGNWLRSPAACGRILLARGSSSVGRALASQSNKARQSTFLKSQETAEIHGFCF